MRKVKFELYGSEKQGYFVGIAGVVSRPSGFGDALLIVEDEEGKVYSVKAEDVQFTSKPINMSPVKRLDLKLMRNALVGINYSDIEKPYTIEDLIELADERNIIIEDTEEISE